MSASSFRRTERLEPRLFDITERFTLPPLMLSSVQPRKSFRDYVPAFGMVVRPVLTPMMRPQTVADPGMVFPFLFSLGVHAAVIAMLMMQHQGMHGSPAGEQPQVEMLFDTPPSKSSMQGPRAHEEGGAPPAPSQDTSQTAQDEQQQPQPDEAAPTPAVPTPEKPSAPPVPQAPSAELPKVAPSRAPVTPGSVASRRNRQTTSHAHRAQHSPHRDSTNPFAHPMDLSFGQQPSQYRRRRGRPAGAGGPIDMSLGPLSMNGAINAPYKTRTSVKGVSEDYEGEIDRWIRSHMYYPEDAARAGEDGPSSVHVVLDRYGHVRSVRLTGQSGSYSLDAATTGMFQGGRLPPIPPDMKGDHFDIDVTINYILIRR